MWDCHRLKWVKKSCSWRCSVLFCNGLVAIMTHVTSYQLPVFMIYYFGSEKSCFDKPTHHELQALCCCWILTKRTNWNCTLCFQTFASGNLSCTLGIVVTISPDNSVKKAYLFCNASVHYLNQWSFMLVYGADLSCRRCDIGHMACKPHICEGPVKYWKRRDGHTFGFS